ncbi:acyl-CoA dehydrogenase [Nocardia carnea]|uniref:acyl-CoA dehydrogenase n=1 Tax=Nocardia carnea TaxID=37328 RepID=UPI000526C835|nr:acyl-CoA dehydrogenase [Nocardia carnea]
MGHYQANLRDIEFNLFEVFELGKLLDAGAYGDLDTDTAREILAEVKRLAEGPVAESFAAADREPVEFRPETHSIDVGEPLTRTILAIREAGWNRLGKPEEMGGMPAPAALIWAVSEMITCANPAAIFFDMGAAMAQVLYGIGNEQQKHWAAAGFERHWQGTMVLTEPDAGSDVGAGRAKAIEQPDGTWHIEGVKRFISGADVGDTAENVFHLVLARPEGAGPGTKGLSLFYVPKYLFDPQTLELGERNGVYVTNVEHKMGLKSSPTCELTFGGEKPAVGWLVGDTHNGIAQMFKVIENARMMVGVKSSGTLSTGYLNALEYAKQRVQGADLTQMSDKAAPRVPITHHPDVRRSLATQKAYAEGLRAVYLYTAVHQDADVAELVSGVDDYPIEQYIRDAKIDSLYEGTTAIQAQDFFFRKIIRDNGVAAGQIFTKINEFLDAPGGRLTAERDLLRTALGDVQGMAAALSGYAMAAQTEPAELYKVGLGSVRFLLAVGDLLIGWLLLWQAEVAAGALAAAAEDRDRPFYTGKVGVASFFAKNVLPTLSSTKTVIENLDTDIMALPEDAF